MKKKLFFLLVILKALLLSNVTSLQKSISYQKLDKEFNPSQCQSIITNLKANQIENVCVTNEILLQVPLDQQESFNLFKVGLGKPEKLQFEIQDISDMLSQASEWSMKGIYKEFEEENKQRLRFLSNSAEYQKENGELSNRLKLIKIVQLHKFIVFDSISQSSYISNRKLDIFNLINQIQKCKQFTYLQVQDHDSFLLACDNKIVEKKENLLKEYEYTNDTDLGVNQKLAILNNNQIYIHDQEKVCNLKGKCFKVDKSYLIKNINHFNMDLFQIQLKSTESSDIDYFVNIPYNIYQLRSFQRDCQICSLKNQNCQLDCFNRKKSSQNTTQQYESLMYFAIYFILSILVITAIVCSFLLNRDKKSFQEMIQTVATFKHPIGLQKIELPQISTEISYLKS
ncbi:transmembrane protein, putative (macronuclear) [Tetrahymena thermophila SB210]|uniref:Transmembrane protein, putative n=1 Tax=Tetrahymena thermophila (strain SB210) TaxID=312017 RepID=Q23F10_TETTS|nr:transmembrane protein, putative [Tetrahymena thermophila SB210]EAR95095.1 transmembrane protein, putative [Tetrahymena thermophila SB210]|eukprot:XP_001015340.1 transmembrane protein, putative [Tetrahymena thermophila SB210]